MSTPPSMKQVMFLCVETGRYKGPGGSTVTMETNTFTKSYIAVGVISKRLQLIKYSYSLKTRSRSMFLNCSCTTKTYLKSMFNKIYAHMCIAILSMILFHSKTKS